MQLYLLDYYYLPIHHTAPCFSIPSTPPDFSPISYFLPSVTCPFTSTLSFHNNHSNPLPCLYSFYLFFPLISFYHLLSLSSYPTPPTSLWILFFSILYQLPQPNVLVLLFFLPQTHLDASSQPSLSRCCYSTITLPLHHLPSMKRNQSQASEHSRSLE